MIILSIRLGYILNYHTTRRAILVLSAKEKSDPKQDCCLKKCLILLQPACSVTLAQKHQRSFER